MKNDDKKEERKPQKETTAEELKDVKKKHIKNDKNFLKAIKKIVGK